MSSPLYHHVVDDDDGDPGNDHVDDQGTAALPIAATATSTHGSLSDNTAHMLSDWKRTRAVLLFSSCTILLFADQNLMAPNLTAIAQEFGFDDDQRDRKLGGQIALAFFVLGAPASFLVGCLADSLNRSRLFAWTVGVGEGACFFTFFTTTYPQLYVCRAITGFSLGGALPLIYSVLGDLFAADERHSAAAVVGIGSGAGIALGQGIAGFLGPSFGWRLPFLVVSIPALMCAAGVLFTVEDPERGGMEQAVREHRRVHPAGSGSSSLELAPLDGSRDKGCLKRQGSSCSTEEAMLPTQEPELNVRVHWKTFQSLLSTPTVVLSLLQGAPGCVPWGIVNTYLNDFLSENRGMTVEFATLTVLVFGLGNFFGMILGGAGGMALYRRDKRYPAILAGASAIMGCFPFWILLNHVNASSSFITIGVVAVSTGLASGVAGPIIKATLQNVTFPQSRGQAFALFNTFDDFGRGLGPVFVASLITRVGGRTQAFNIGVLGWVFCGFFNLIVFFTVERDERNLQTAIAASLSKAPAEQITSVGLDYASQDSDGYAPGSRRRNIV